MYAYSLLSTVQQSNVSVCCAAAPAHSATQSASGATPCRMLGKRLNIRQKLAFDFVFYKAKQTN
jgi:hypothetical protein